MNLLLTIIRHEDLTLSWAVETKKKGHWTFSGSARWNQWKINSWLILTRSFKWAQFSIPVYSRPRGRTWAHLCSSLVTQNNTGSLHCCLPSACLCCLFCLPFLLTSCSLYCVAADTHGKQAERSLSLSLFLLLSFSVTCPLIHTSNKRGPVWGGPPLWQFVTLCQLVECHWVNITSSNVALCDTAFEVEKSATCERLEGTLLHGCMFEKLWLRPKWKWKEEICMCLWCVCAGWGA